VKVPVEVGVPERTPVEGFKVIPEGKEPDVTEKIKGVALLPVAVMV